MKVPALFKSLRFVMALQVALPVLLLLGVLLVVSLSLLGNFIESRMQRDLQLVARTIYLPVSQALERQDLEQLQNSMASVFGLTEVYGAYLFDGQGRQLSSFGAVNPTRQQATDALAQIVDGEFSQYEQIRGRDVYSFFMPLFDETGQPDGLLQVTRKRSDIDQELAQIRLWAWSGFVLISVLVLGVLSLAHQRAIGKPLNQLLSSMRRVSAGEQAHRAELAGPAEIHQLASNMNGMLDAIALAEQNEARQRVAREAMSEKLRQSETLVALGQLAAGVAHELGAPLSVVDGRARRLLRRTQAEPDIKELQDIREQAARMTAIVEQLLNYGRSSRAEKRGILIAELIGRIVMQLRETGYDVTVQGGPNCQIQGDPLGIEQALVNLLRNACQACPAGPVQISWQIDGQRVEICVADAGPGIPEDKRQTLFEPFVTTKPPGQGSGLGLAIVKRIVREHQGEVQLKDSPLGGAQFSVFLPLSAVIED